MGVATLWLLPNNPEHVSLISTAFESLGMVLIVLKAYFLNAEEKAHMKARKDAEYGQTAAAQEFSKVDMIKAFKDWKCWAFWFAQFGTDTMLYG